MMVISERSSLEEEKNTTVFTNSRKNKHKYILSGAHYSNNNQYILGSKNIHHQISTQKEVKEKRKLLLTMLCPSHWRHLIKLEHTEKR